MIPATRLQDLFKLMGPGGFEDLLATLASDLRRAAAELDAALGRGDSAELARVCHMLISLAAMLAARDFADHARAAERAALGGGPAAAPLGRALLAEIGAVAEELRAARLRPTA